MLASQPLARMAANAVTRVDARNAQDADAHMGALAEAPQLRFSVDAPCAAVGGWAGGACFVEPRAACIAIHAACAAVDDAPRRRAARERLQQVRGARITAAGGGWRRKVQHGIGHASDSRQARCIVKVADDGRDAGCAQLRHACS